MEAIKLLEITAETFQLFQLGALSKSALVVVLLASLVTIVFVKSSFARFILFSAPKKRPLNILIMTHQVRLIHEFLDPC